MTTPTTPFYTSSPVISWGMEQKQISNILGLITKENSQKISDGLGGIMEHISGSSYGVKFEHPHVELALEIIAGYPFPKDFQDFYKCFRFREWDIVCEAVMVAVRLKRLVPNEFQHFLLGIYIAEHHPICCPDCGLTMGFWCGESFLITLFTNY
jgi:hypothetical protein